MPPRGLDNHAEVELFAQSRTSGKKMQVNIGRYCPGGSQRPHLGGPRLPVLLAIQRYASTNAASGRIFWTIYIAALRWVIISHWCYPTAAIAVLFFIEMTFLQHLKAKTRDQRLPLSFSGLLPSHSSFRSLLQISFFLPVVTRIMHENISSLTRCVGKFWWISIAYRAESRGIKRYFPQKPRRFHSLASKNKTFSWFGLCCPPKAIGPYSALIAHNNQEGTENFGSLSYENYKGNEDPKKLSLIRGFQTLLGF